MMLKNHPDRVCVSFALDFDAQVGYARRLSEAVEAVQGRLATKHWSCTTERYFLREPAKRFYLSIEFARLSFMGLGLNAWMSGLNDFVGFFRTALEKMGVRTVRRIGFKTQAFIPVEMNHNEINELMFGSYLVEARELEAICGKPDDVTVELHGTFKGMKTRTIIAPVTADQAATAFMANPNLELLIEPKLYDAGLKDFRDRIARDCLIVDVELHQADVNPEAIQAFANGSLDAAETITEAAVFRLEKKPTKARSGNGNPR